MTLYGASSFISFEFIVVLSVSDYKSTKKKAKRKILRVRMSADDDTDDTDDTGLFLSSTAET